MPTRRKEQMRRVFETRSHAWADVGLARQLSRATVKRARIQTIVLIPVIIGLLVGYAHRKELFPGLGAEVRIITVIALIAIGWAFARALRRVRGPPRFPRPGPRR